MRDASPCIPDTDVRSTKASRSASRVTAFAVWSSAPAIAAMAKIGLSSCELWQAHVEPRGVSREELRRWRENVSLEEFRRIGEAFNKAGIALSAYNISFQEHFTDAEIERGFEMAKALGAPCITSSSQYQDRGASRAGWPLATACRSACTITRGSIPTSLRRHRISSRR